MSRKAAWFRTRVFSSFRDGRFALTNRRVTSPAPGDAVQPSPSPSARDAASPPNASHMMMTTVNKSLSLAVATVLTATMLSCSREPNDVRFARGNTYEFSFPTAEGSRGVLAGDSVAIHLAKSLPGVARIERYPGAFAWEVVGWCASRYHCPHITGSESPSKFPVRVVCYCDRAHVGLGWYVEVHLDTRRAYAINGNTRLEVIYGIIDCRKHPCVRGPRVPSVTPLQDIS